MNRPEVILNVFSSVDGRITTAPNRNVSEWTAAGIDGDANEETHILYDELDCDGLISGSETLNVFGNHFVDLQEPIYWPQKSKAYIVFDGKGRIDWGQTDGLIVVTKEDVPGNYLKQLKKKKIDYIKTGPGTHIDIELALDKLYDRGFRRLGLTGGGKINGAFLRGGFIDKISLVYAPLAVGGTRTPSVFDSDDLNDLQGITQLELIKTKTLGQGCVWVYYKVKN